MEASAILKMVEDAYYNRFFIIDVIVSNNDSTMRAVLKHLIMVSEVKFLRNRKGNLMSKSQSLPFLQIPPIALSLWPSTSFTSSMIVRLRDVGAPEQMLSDSKKFGGT